MGTMYKFRCDKCGYEVMSSGGHDYGMLAVVDTYICKSCKKIVDVTVGEYGVTYTKKDILTKKNKETDLEFYICPECEVETHLVKWNKSKRPCPKCEGKMEKDVHGEIMMWD